MISGGGVELDLRRADIQLYLQQFNACVHDSNLLFENPAIRLERHEAWHRTLEKKVKRKSSRTAYIHIHNV